MGYVAAISFVPFGFAVVVMLVYKSSAMVAFNIHQQLQSLSLADLATTIRSSIHSLLFVEMFSKSFAASILLLVLTSSVNADFVFGPPLGVQGNPVQGDVQRPPSGKPCGGMAISENVKNSTCAKAEANGNFPVAVHSFGS